MSRPKVIVWQQASLDGRLAVSPGRLLLHGDERWTAIQGARDSDLDPQGWLQAHHGIGASLEGSGSFVLEGAEPEALSRFEGRSVSLYQDYLPTSVLQRTGHRGWFMVVDGRGRGRGWIKDGAVFGEAWAGWHLLVLAGRHTPAEYLAYLRRQEIPYLVAGDGPVDLVMALEKVKTRLGVDSVLSTAGGRLNGALLRAGLVDEVNVEFLAALIGGQETPSLFAAPSLGPDEWPTRLELISAQVSNPCRGAAESRVPEGGCVPTGRVWLRYRVIRWPAQAETEVR